MLNVSLEERAYEHIRRKLLRGALRPGEALREATLGKEIGVSRTPVRHAIRQLEREGVVAQVPGFGSYVKKPTLREVQDILELRIILERSAAALAAERITPAGLVELKAACDEMLAIVYDVREQTRTNPDLEFPESFGLADVRFHELIVRAAGNEQVIKLIKDKDLIARVCFFNNKYPQPLLANLINDYRTHYRVYQAIRRRDPDLAGARMEAQIRIGVKTIMDWLSAQPDYAER